MFDERWLGRARTTSEGEVSSLRLGVGVARIRSSRSLAVVAARFCYLSANSYRGLITDCHDTGRRSHSVFDADVRVLCCSVMELICVQLPEDADLASSHLGVECAQGVALHAMLITARCLDTMHCMTCSHQSLQSTRFVEARESTMARLALS